MKGGGIWPFEALATILMAIRKGANSNLALAGIDKQEFVAKIKAP